MNVLQAIGNTSLVRLRRVVPPGCAKILVKLEWENPTGSVKDRMAEAVIARAESDGRLEAGDTVVEYTGGSTGTSLALVCAAKGYRIRIVTSDAFSQEKRDHMAALGAELTLVPSEGGLTTKKLILDMIEAARELSREPRAYLGRSAQQRGHHRGLLSAGRGDLDPDRRRGRRLRPLRGHRGFVAGRGHGAEALQARRPDRRGRARRVLGAARRTAGAPQDRGRRDRLHAAPLGRGLGGRSPAGRNRRGEGHGAAARSGGGALRREPPPVPTSSPPSGWRSVSGPGPRWSR